MRKRGRKAKEVKIAAQDNLNNNDQETTTTNAPPEKVQPPPMTA